MTKERKTCNCDKEAKLYECAFCGRTYDTIKDRMACEQACAKRVAEEEAKAAEEKKKAEYDKRKAEVDAAVKKANELTRAFARDYGEYHFETKSNWKYFRRIFVIEFN